MSSKSGTGRIPRPPTVVGKSPITGRASPALSWRALLSRARLPRSGRPPKRDGPTACKLPLSSNARPDGDIKLIPTDGPDYGNAHYLALASALTYQTDDLELRQQTAAQL